MPCERTFAAVRAIAEMDAANGSRYVLRVGVGGMCGEEQAPHTASSWKVFVSLSRGILPYTDGNTSTYGLR